MATGFDDFNGATTGAGIPTGWTAQNQGAAGNWSIVEDVDGADGKVLQLTNGTGSAWCTLSNNAATAEEAADFEILVRFRFHANNGAVNNGLELVGRGVETTTFAEATFIAGRVNCNSNNNLRAHVRDNGAGTFLGDVLKSSVRTGHWQWLRFRADGEDLYVKHWFDSEEEPGSWRVSQSSSAIEDAGFIGITSSTYSSGTAVAWQVDYFGYGTGGDAAPSSAASSTPVSFSGTVPTQNLTEDSAMSALDLSSYFSGTETPFSYAVQTGTLPAGLSLNSSTGVISGTPTATGTASIVVRATDDGSDTADTNSFDIVVAAADVTAPTLSSPSGTQTGSTTADLSVYTNEGNGTLYWVVTTSATSPSVAQVQAGLDHTGAAAADDGSQVVSGTGAQSANATGLTADTTYYVHFQQEDAATNDSTVSTSSSFTTATAAVAVKGIQLSLKQADGTTAAANLTGLYYHAWDALNPGGASDANGSTETTDGSGVLEININSFSAAIDGEVFLFVYDLDGAEDKDSVCFAGRVPVVDIS